MRYPVCGGDFPQLTGHVHDPAGMVMWESTAYGFRSLLGFMREAMDDNTLDGPVRWYGRGLEDETACFSYSEL